MVQWVKDQPLSQPWCGFDPWLQNFHMPQVKPKKKKKKSRNAKKQQKKSLVTKRKINHWKYTEK